MTEGIIKQRIITALVALPLLILLVLFASQTLFNLFVLLAAVLGLVEFYGMVLPADRLFERSMAIAFGTLFAAFICWQQPHSALLVLVLTLLLLSMIYLFRFGEISQVMQHLALTVFGLLYIPLLLGHLAMLRHLENGPSWVLMTLVIAMTGDSAALFTGKAFGRRKLYPAVSPNKSVEGAIGGLIGSVAGAFIFKLLFFAEAGGPFVLLMAVVLSVLAQTGDLFESLLKRSCQVKDSGTMIPGHGGVLDRLDSLLFVFPAAYYLIFFIG